MSAAVAVAAEMAEPCPPGGWLSRLGECSTVRPFGVAVIVVAAVLYVVALTAVRWWTSGLQARRVADARAARDWYLLAAALGLGVAPLLAFTLVSALR